MSKKSDKPLDFGRMKNKEFTVNIKPKNYEYLIACPNKMITLEQNLQTIFKDIVRLHTSTYYKPPNICNQLYIASIREEYFKLETDNILLRTLCDMKQNDNKEDKKKRNYYLDLKRGDTFAMKSPTLMLEHFGEIYFIPELVFGTYKGVPKKMTFCSNELKLKNQTRFFYMEDPETDLEFIDILVTEI